VSEMSSQAADLARRLARDAEAVCRHYLSLGHRRGRYWVVGDVANTPGRSLFVRLAGPDSGKGAAGKWTDAATGQHGDLLDLIALNRGLEHLHDVLDEARSFLSLPRPEPPSNRYRRQPPAQIGSPESARRLFAMSQRISGTIAEAYLRNRGISVLHDVATLRFHPRCFTGPMLTRQPKCGRHWSPPSPTSPAASRAHIAPGSIPPASTRPRSIRRGGQWGICWGMESGSG